MLNFLPGFAAFAIAGLVAASGPVIIHLLNRRRFKTVEWAAMDFLREAMQRNRRILEIRDLVLLVTRTLAILLFGLALARPFVSASSSIAWQTVIPLVLVGMLAALVGVAFWSRPAARWGGLGLGIGALLLAALLARQSEATGEDSAAVQAGNPLHAVLLVDNSLSMGYEQLSGTVLAAAKTKATEFIDKLPPRSLISVLPLCGSANSFSTDPYRTREDALAALEKIEVVDRTGTAAQAAALALEACRQGGDVPQSAQRVVLLTDVQALNWPAESLAKQFETLPELQVVDLAAKSPENTWVESVAVQDGVADTETLTQIVAQVRHTGTEPRTGVQVSLTVGGEEVATRTINSLEPGQSTQVVFEHRFEDMSDARQVIFVPISVALPPDRLPGDDARHLAVPVVAGVTVLFIDQYGDQEDRAKNKYGETASLRNLLAPRTTRGDATRQLIQIDHLRIDQLTKSKLQNARLVVIAGVEGPEGSVELLRDYVRQGGQLVIATGGEFDPAAWNAEAWRDGGGILPAPLAEEFLGRTPEEAPQEVKPFFLNFESLTHGHFQLPEVPRGELEDLYRTPIFFKTAQPQLEAKIVAEMLAAETKRLETLRSQLAEIAAREEASRGQEAAGKLDDNALAAREADEAKRRELEPNWLAWSNDRPDTTRDLTPVQLAEREQPRGLAKFTNDVPFLVERKIGRGQVLFVSSAVFAQSPWNTIGKTSAFLIFDRVLRSMIEQTLPRMNVGTSEQFTLPVNDRSLTYSVKLPGGREQELSIDALGGTSGDEYGVVLRDLSQRGLYSISAKSAESQGDQPAGTPVFTLPVCANGLAEESELAALSEDALAERMTGREGNEPANYRWVGQGEAISMEGAQVWGQNLWWWLTLAVLACLAIEMTVVVWPAVAAPSEG